MCLSIAVERPEDVLGEGLHKGIEWMVIHNGMGSRCGYARIPKGHPWHGQEVEDKVKVHGGITFAQADVPCDKGGADDAYWVGFDCAHCDDAPDPTLPSKLDSTIQGMLGRYGVVRTQEYAEGQCRKLCEQIAAAAA